MLKQDNQIEMQNLQDLEIAFSQVWIQLDRRYNHIIDLASCLEMHTKTPAVLQQPEEISKRDSSFSTRDSSLVYVQLKAQLKVQMGV